ncbi:MAG: TIGR03984 family CRISPR-associated protein [Cyanobacteria bacterium CRU_2_1]|nr:TIGR03984 family CRISPR-associated protein [Leptolyngbyaceae cyanobacterium RU_5_1]NJR61345.1 TIGR03984 family CRISPR-associated protein [Cyanobacteria bacterium CRU_2_1]
MTTLQWRTSSQLITLADALNAECSVALLENAVALLYTPRSCQFARYQNGTLLDAEEQAVDFDPVFEARVFNSKAELRWLNETAGLGRAVLLSEDETLPEFEQSVLDRPTKSPLSAVRTIPQRYLLWGKGHEPAIESDTWSILSEARIGQLRVPVGQLKAGQTVYLQAIEYLAEVDCFGNVAVVEERLLGLEVSKS